MHPLPKRSHPVTHSGHAAHAAAGAPLAGVRVLDLTRLPPGPMCTLHLADLGADVIKIEDTGAGDYAAAPVRDMVNRNKRGIRLDLKHPAGLGRHVDVAIADGLLAHAVLPMAAVHREGRPRPHHRREPA